MNREEARKRYQEEVSKYIHRAMGLLEENFLKEEESLIKNIYEELFQLFSDCADKGQIWYIQMSLLRSKMDEDIYEILLSVHNENYFLDTKPLMQTVDVSYIFAPLKEVRAKFYQYMECYQGKVEKFDADRIIREIAIAFFKNQAEHCRILFRDLDRCGIEERKLQGKRLVVKWGGFQEASETVFLADSSEKDQQQFFIYNEKNTISEWDSRYVYQSWEAVHFIDMVVQKRNLLFIMLRNCEIERCQWENCMMHGASFRDAKLKQVIFAGCDLSGSDFRGAMFEQVQFIQCNLSAADFTGIGLEMVQFTGSRMENARFSRDSLSCQGLDVSQLQQIWMKEEPYVF